MIIIKCFTQGHNMLATEGLQPVTFGLWDKCCIQWSLDHACLLVNERSSNILSEYYNCLDLYIRTC